MSHLVFSAARSYYLERAVFLLVFLLAFQFRSARAQELSLYNIVTDSFPRISANYIAIDPAGTSISDLSARDFRVVETTLDGRVQDLSASVIHSCVQQSSSSSMSIVLIVDESNSMDQVLPGGRRRIDYVKEALRSFVDRLPWNGETAVSIISFSGKSRLLCDWQTSPAGVRQAIDRLTPLSATNYEVSFFGVPNVFDQMKKRPPSIPKVAFFITDGSPNPDIVNRPLFQQRTIAEALSQGMRLYSVTLMIGKTDPSIDVICRATGGRSIIAKEEELVNLTSVLAFEATSSQVCTISWLSPIVCNDKLQQRSAVVQLRRGRQPDVTITYTTPESSVARVVATPSTVICGDIAPSTKTTVDIVVTASNVETRLNTASINAPAFFRITNFVPVTLKPGESRTYTIEFSQGVDRAIRQGVLSFTGTPACLPSVLLLGGGGAIVLTSPNGGEVLSTCSEITISWTGVPEYQPVTLEYSCIGADWSTIVDTATGNTFRWRPPQGCTAGRIRVRTLPGERFIWGAHIGGTARDTATCIATTGDGTRTYVTGSFVGQTQIGSYSANAIFNMPDGFLAEFDAVGNITNVKFLRGDIGTSEVLARVATDVQGNVYVVGLAQGRSITFGTDQWNRGPLDEQDACIYKFRPDGSMAWRLIAGGTDFISSNVNITSLDVRQGPTGIEVLVVGTCENIISMKSASGVVQDERDVPDNQTFPFSALINEMGQPRISVGNESAAFTPSDPLVSQDLLGYRYVPSTFRGNTTIPLVPPMVLSSRGQTDVAVMKSAIGIATNDVSDGTFRVLSPILASDISSFLFDSTGIGRSTIVSSSLALQNIGTEVLVIDSLVVSGKHALDFRVIGEFGGVTIEPDAVHSLELAFTPSAVGLRTAILTAYGSCGNSIVFTLLGEGRPECSWELTDTIDVGKVIVGSASTKTFNCILRSQRRAGSFRGVVTVTGSKDFTVTPTGVFTLRYGECVNVRVTFTPTSIGTQVAEIHMNLPSECGIAFVQLFGEGILPELSVADIDFGNRRIGSSTTQFVPVVNDGTISVEVTGLALVDTAGTGLTAAFPKLPVVISPGDTLQVPITFVPVSRQYFLARLNVTAENIDSTLSALIRGAGYRPEISASGYSFQPVLAQTTSAETGRVTIRNADNQWPLTISDVRMETGQLDYTWGPLTIVFPYAIPPRDSITLPVEFRPAVPGRRSAFVDVYNDAVNGNEPVQPIVTRVMIDGVGLQRSTIAPVVFDTILSCLTASAIVQIPNDDPTSALDIKGIIVDGDAGAFTLQPVAPFSVPAGSSVDAIIEFVPATPGFYAASFTLLNDRGLDLAINVRGTAVSTPLATILATTITGTIGESIELPIQVQANSMSPFIPNEISFFIQFPARTLRFKEFRQAPDNGWAFSKVTENETSLLIKATNVTSSQVPAGQFVVPVFDSYLSASRTLPVTVSISTPHSCISPSGSRAVLELESLCFTAARLVRFGTAQYAISAPYPDPTSDILTIPVSIGIAGGLSIEIVDMRGKIIHTATVPYMAAGDHYYRLPVDFLDSGVYSIHLVSGPFSAWTPFRVIH